MTPDEAARRLEERLGLELERRELLISALTHRSYLNEDPDHPYPDSERLEFLGDAVLGFLAGEYLYQAFPEAREGQLTFMRAALVNAEALARLAGRIGLGPLLLLSRGEAASGGRSRPALLSAAFEALVGAIFLDRGLEVTRSFVQGLIAEEVEELANGSLEKDAKSLLQERVQARWQITPHYRTVEERGPDHAREFTVEVLIGGQRFGQGSGRSKQAAEQAAARQALATLGGDGAEGPPQDGPAVE